MSNQNQKPKQLGLVGKMKRQLEAGKGKKDSPDGVRKECRLTLELLARGSSMTRHVDDGKKEVQQHQKKPSEPPTAGPPQEPPPALSIFGGALNSVDIVRHFQSNDSYTVDINSWDSNCTDKQEYLDLIQGINAAPLPEFTNLDVLPGPGKGNHHPGHQEYLDLISARAQDYENTNNAGKSALAQEVIDIVHEQGGRFIRDIQKEEDQANKRQYTEIPVSDNDLLLEKVKNAFRGRLKILRKQEAES